MARRRFQDPKPFKRGSSWILKYWQDDFSTGQSRRKQVWKKLGPSSMQEREAKRIAAELLRPINQGLETIGGATNFRDYVINTYETVEMPLLASTTRGRYLGVIKNYLLPAFGTGMLKDITPLAVQKYFSQMAGSQLSHESIDKLKDVLSSIMGSALKYGLIVKNPVDGVKLPPQRRGKRQAKPHITAEQFARLVDLLPEPVATMVYVAIWTGLRISELIALKWNDIGADTITVDERFCRGDWSEPKSEASNATIGVTQDVIDRLHRLKLLTIDVKAGRSVRNYKLVKSAGPNDLVFQSVKDGRPMRDNNLLSRFLKPAAHKLGIEKSVNWRSLRTSRATWMIEAGANPKDVQGQMRHSRVQTTLDVYAQFVPESQRRAVEKTYEVMQSRIQVARERTSLIELVN